MALWLVNSWRLLNLLRQYSSEKNFDWNTQNTEMQNSQCIKNFHLEPLRNQLKLRVEVFYSNLMKRTVEPLLIPKIGKIVFYKNFFLKKSSYIQKNYFSGKRVNFF